MLLIQMIEILIRGDKEVGGITGHWTAGHT